MTISAHAEARRANSIGRCGQGRSWTADQRDDGGRGSGRLDAGAERLRESPQTPQLRATLYRALALVPGVQLLGEVHDRLGRAAIGVAFTEHTGMRQELLLDPETAEVLNERQVVAHRAQGIRAASGTAVEDVVYTKRAVTDATTRP